MFAVIFEVQPKAEKFNDYLDLAKFLKPKLESIEGFIDNERFESTRRRGWILSHSTWRDEKSVVRWRTVGKHHDTQQRELPRVVDTGINVVIDQVRLISIEQQPLRKCCGGHS